MWGTGTHPAAMSGCCHNALDDAGGWYKTFDMYVVVRPPPPSPPPSPPLPPPAPPALPPPITESYTQYIDGFFYGGNGRHALEAVIHRKHHGRAWI
eukprot:4036275-Prymnesium_polylepis.1